MTKKPKAPTPPRKRPPGRPPLPFDQAVADEICERMTGGESLRKICKDEHLPAAATVFKWLVENKSFAEQYARAREAQMDTMVEEILTIADDGSNDFKADDDGRTVVDKDHIQRSRLRIDTRKWLMSKLAPKKYSDKIDVNHGGQPENPVNMLLEQVAGRSLRPQEDEGEA